MRVRWTPLEKAIVKKLVDEGMSATAIANHLRDHGRSATRNAVIGLLSRMGVSAKSQARRSRPTTRRARPVPIKPAAGPLQPAVKVACEPIQPVPLMKLADHHCRWPIGDVGTSDFGFCGRSKLAGLSYCADHSRRAAQR